jgi:hypothetical protein
MGEGKLLSYSKDDIRKGNAIGVQDLPKTFHIELYTERLLWLIMEKDLRTQLSFNY